jgi:Flp pilus assembly protein TadD
MTHYLAQIRLFLGAGRLRLLVFLFISTGILSGIFALIPEAWAITAQTLLLLLFLAAVVVIVVGRMQGDRRYRWGATLMPAVGLLALGALFFPEFFMAFVGGAVGWIAAGIFIFGKDKAPRQYKEAIKYMRKNEYEAAVKTMDTLIKEEPKEPNHYRFRAELLRLWDKHGRAKRDYEHMLELAHDDATKAVAYNGLAELDLQKNKFQEALHAAQKAYDLAPHEWVAAYNLGMIQDRLHQSQPALASLQQALQAKIPDARHRLLVYLYMVRAHSRLGDLAAAQTALVSLKKQRAGLNEWQVILNSPQAEVLRSVLAEDVATAGALIEGTLTVEALTGANGS